MRLLIVEDDANYLKALREALSDIRSLDIIEARSRDSAVSILLDEDPTDLILCDLRIPTEDGGLNDELEHGISVVTTAQTEWPGTPIVIHSAYADRHVIPRLTETAPHHDYVGTGNDQPMIVINHKDDLRGCLRRVRQLSEELNTLSHIAIASGARGIEFDEYEKRALRIFARRRNGSVISVAELRGGLSSSRVLHIELTGPAGDRKALVVAKVGVLESIRDERGRFEEHVVPLLPPGAFTSLVDDVEAGAGHLGALFYRISEDAPSLFAVLEDAPDSVVDLLNHLRENFDPWHKRAPTQRESIRQIRRSVIGDDEFERLAEEHLNDIDWEKFENQTVQVRKCVQHGDLHGENIMVARGQPLVIDFGEVRPAVASLDQIVLELSLLFHPTGREIVPDWPSIEQAEKWHDLDSYVADCPVPSFVRHCREWAFEVGENDRAVFANLYAHAVRQLKYDDTEHQLAVAIVKSALLGFSET